MNFISKLFFAAGSVLLTLITAIFVEFIFNYSEILINPKVLPYYRYSEIFTGFLMLISFCFICSITAKYLSKK